MSSSLRDLLRPGYRLLMRLRAGVSPAGFRHRHQLDVLVPGAHREVGRSLPSRPDAANPRVDAVALSKTRTILLACFPKSGSTYVSRLLAKLTGFPLRDLVQFYGHNEQDLFEPRLQSLVGTDAVVQQHLRATGNNLFLLRKYGIRPVFLHRDIHDVIVSVRDHLARESIEGPGGYIHPEYQSMSAGEQLDFLIVRMLPWYLDMFVSWRDASKDWPVLWIGYEEFFADQVAGLRRILNFHGLSAVYDDESLSRGIADMGGEGTRFNVGRSGRGREQLSVAQRQAIAAIAARWKLGDDSLRAIGLDGRELGSP